MSARTTKSITWLWIASLFIATVGVSGQQIYCYCMGKTTFSLFKAEDACVAERKTPSKNCCAVPKAKSASNCCENGTQTDKTTGCTKKDTKVFQLKTEFTVQEKATEKWSAPAHEQDLAPVCFHLPPVVYSSAKVGYSGFAQPPPPLSGRIICIRHGVFRC